MAASGLGKDTDADLAMPVPLDPAKPPPLDRFCDLVLKGGVVDGVVYPAAIMELARHYRFNGLAGTSVGAIAAGITAAAEYARRFGSDDGFNEVLRKIPDELAETETETETGTEAANAPTRLFRLFHPDSDLRRLFTCFVEAFSVKREEFWWKLTKQVFNQYKLFVFSGFVFCFVALELATRVVQCFALKVANCSFEIESLAISNIGLVGVLLLCVIFALGYLGWALWRDVRKLSGDGFGFCSGLSLKGFNDEAMTDWIHRGIQSAAKLPLGRPLTFKDLWDAPGGPKLANGARIPKSIDLRMISTSVSHGRPYEFPLNESASPLFFRICEFKKYFPESVMDYLKESALKYDTPDFYYSPSGNKVRQNSPDPSTAPKDLRYLPVGELPVLVAIRLSMNCPILFKAVPLWAIDRESGPVLTPNPSYDNLSKAPEFKTCWFTDGGVTSNFPIHFFDEALPSWPTFGVFVAEKSRDADYQTKNKAATKNLPPPSYLPEFHTTGRSEKWFEIKESLNSVQAKKPSIAPLTNYVLGMFSAAKDWSDNANMRMPGVRERVVTVYKNLPVSNGGLNLKLPKDKIIQLGHKSGKEAGRRLVDKFVLSTDRQNPLQIGTDGWRDHRWTRLNAYLLALRTHLQGFSRSANDAVGTTPIQHQIQQAKSIAPLKTKNFFEPTLTQEQAAALQTALGAVQTLEASLASIQVEQPYRPSPQPVLSLRPQL